jgi:two-component system sensor histidine kinase KdpD
LDRLERQIIRYVHALGWVIVSTVAAEVVYRLTGATRLSMVFLSGVLVAAFFLGTGPAYFAAGLAFLIYNLYLSEPRFSISFQPEDVINLVVFLAVAMLTGSLTGRVREEAARAEARAKATDGLFEATREFSALPEDKLIREKLAEHLAAAAGGAAFVMDGRRIVRPEGVDLSPEMIREAQALDRSSGEAAQTAKADGWTLRTLRTAGLPLGVAGWRAGPAPPQRPWWHPDRPSAPLWDPDGKLLEIVADAGAAALGRARLVTEKGEAETRARTEDLRNALLSSISHDLRTPLAAIMASASSLQEFGDSFDPDVRKDLAATIQEEAERLDAFVANLLNMTRLEAGALSIQRAPFSVPEVVSRAIDRRIRSTTRLLLNPAPANLPEAMGDPVLFEQALGNVIENALRYTPDAATLAVSSRLEDEKVVVEVRDSGPGLPEQELKRIFDKFYRSPHSASQSGTGLGLAIARGLMEAMDGSIAAHNRVDAESGLVVTLRLAAA